MARAKDFSFVGRLCLDFAQTGDMGWGARYERFTSPSELGRWLTLCPLHVPVPSITAADVEQAIGLRKAIWRVSQALLAGDTSRVAAAIATIAQDAVLLFGDSQQRARLRCCENSSCRVVFFDDSRPGARRWCFPNRCGDRVRAREYRRRHA